VGRWVTGDDHFSWATAGAWAVLVLLTLVSLVSTVTWDQRNQPTTGDENSYLMQALSLAFDGHNMSYDSADTARWQALELAWSPEPQGIYVRPMDTGFLAAKPYAYPLYLAPFIAVAGFSTGLAVANALLLLTVVVLAVAIVRTTMSGPGVPLLVSAFTFAGALYLYSYAVSVELLFAAITAVAVLGYVRWFASGRFGWAIPAFVAVGLMAAEKPPSALALAVPGAVVVWKSRGWLRRVAGPALVVVTFVVAVSPWLYYSGGNSYSPYETPRGLAFSAVWDTLTPQQFADELQERNTSAGSSVFSPSGAVNRVARFPEFIPGSAWYSMVGRHTGLIVWAPLSVIALIAGLVGFRRLDVMGRAMLLALLGYGALYLVLFTRNYFGGSHALGNRYFVQISPMVLGLLAQQAWQTRKAVAASLGAMAFSLVLLWPHHTDPRWAYLRIDRTSAIQELFPAGSNHVSYQEFRCAAAYGYEFECNLPAAQTEPEITHNNSG
jgi:4-amino-4-deoxy-L-arabinose transferase-like glycosyltransferase